MPRAQKRTRLELPGGIYHVKLHSFRNGASASIPQMLIGTLHEQHLFEECLGWALRYCGAQMYAYCCLPYVIHLLLKLSDCQLDFAGNCLGLLVKRICGRYTQMRNRLRGKSGALFKHEYTAKLVEPERYLLNVVRYIHRRPVLEGIAHGPDRYPWSSHHAYCKPGRRISCLTPAPVIRLLQARGSDPAIEYDLLMSTSESRDIVNLIEQGSEADPRVIGGRPFINTLPARLTEYRPSVTREQLVDAAASMFKVDPTGIQSRIIRGKEMSQARALVAWQAVRNGMKPQDIALWLNRTWPTLLVLIERHRREHLDLFDLPITELIVLTEPPEPRVEGMGRR